MQGIGTRSLGKSFRLGSHRTLNCHAGARRELLDCTDHIIADHQRSYHQLFRQCCFRSRLGYALVRPLGRREVRPSRRLTGCADCL